MTAYQRQQLEEGSDLAARLPLWVEHLRHFPGLRPSAAAAAAGLGGSVMGSPAGNWFLPAALHYTLYSLLRRGEVPYLSMTSLLAYL